MLGYVRTQAPELRLRDQECYRALYCGLCRHMGKCTGQCSRMALSYDFVFLAALRISLRSEELTMEKKRCALHPTKKRLMAIDSPTLAFCADASALLTYHKCRDDIADEHGLKKLRARLASAFFSRGYKKAKKRHPELDAAIARELSRLSDYEKDASLPPSADAPAAIFGEVMAAVFGEGLEGTERRIAENVGHAVGRWIYLSDAADDFARDARSNAFNPYLRLFGKDPTEEDWNGAELAMKCHLLDAERAFSLIDPHPMSEVHEILCNILYLGLPATADRIIKQNRKGDQTT